MEITKVDEQNFLLRIADINILIDCHLSLSNLTNYPPPSLRPTPSINYATSWIDALPPLDLILVSNSTKIRALPFLKSQAHSTKILMTELVSKLGLTLCEELVYFDSEFMRKSSATSQMYTKNDVKQSIRITPVSSGHSLGACNWIIQWEDLKLGVCSDSCLEIGRYPSLFDKNILHVNVLVFTPSHSPRLQPYTQKSLYNNLIEACRSLPNQSSLIIPIDSWHILEVESHVLAAASAFNMPVLSVSHSSKAYMSYAAGSTDWLNPELKHKAYSPQNCFSFEVAQEKKQFSAFSSLQDGFGAALVPHCILLLSHSSMRFGEADYVISYFAKKGGLHTLYLIDPDYPKVGNEFYHEGVLSRFIVNEEFIQVGLSSSHIEELLTQTTAHTVFLPHGFEVSNPLVRYYNQSEHINVRPLFVSVKTNIKEPGAVRGKFFYTDYKKEAVFTERAEALKQVLKELGYEVIVANHNNCSVLKVLGGEIIFRGKRTEIKGKTVDIREALHTFLGYAPIKSGK